MHVVQGGWQHTHATELAEGRFILSIISLTSTGRTSLDMVVNPELVQGRQIQHAGEADQTCSDMSLK